MHSMLGPQVKVEFKDALSCGVLVGQARPNFVVSSHRNIGKGEWNETFSLNFSQPNSFVASGASFALTPALVNVQITHSRELPMLVGLSRTDGPQRTGSQALSVPG